MKKLLGLLALTVLAGSMFVMISGKVGATKPVFGQGGDDAELAKQISLGILRDRSAQRASGNLDEFQIQKVEIDDLKMAHTRVRQTVGGIPVREGQAIVHLKADGTLSTVTDDLRESLYVDTNPVINKKQAVQAAIDAYAGNAKMSQDPTTDLWVFRGETRDHLVYRVTTPRIDGSDETSVPVTFVDAHNGEVVFSYNNLQTGSGPSRYSGTVSISTTVSGATYYNGLDVGATPVVDVPHSHAAAAKAVELARSGEVDALMKGSLHTDELMSAVVAPQGGLRTGRRVSHVFVLDVPRYPKPLLITDAAVNIEPDLEAKADIVRNAIDLAHALGIPRPKVALLSAVETVTPKLRSSIDAAALCKMAERGQITGGVLDGPLAFDNAVSEFAAKIKGIESEVAGQADVLVVPDIVAGNMLAKQLESLADAQAAGVVLGARVPIVLTSRADSAHSRIASCAVALLLHHHLRKSS